MNGEHFAERREKKTTVFYKTSEEAKEAFAAWLAAQIEGSRKVRTYKCPLCGTLIKGKAYPLDDLDDHIQVHLAEKHFGEDEK